MPRSRVNETPQTQRQSPRGPLQLRTSSSDSDSTHNRHLTDRSPKVGDRRSPRRVQPDPMSQKKLGTRIADLESQLGQAQEELKHLKEQLASAEAAKKEAQEELEKKMDKPAPKDSLEIQESNENDGVHNDLTPDENQPKTGGIEVKIEETLQCEQNVELANSADKVEKEADQKVLNDPQAQSLESTKPPLLDSVPKTDNVSSEIGSLQEKEKKMETCCQENVTSRKQQAEVASEMSSISENEMAVRFGKMGEELEASKTNAAHLQEKLEVAERANTALEAEMAKLRVQTEQWRKAADAAAAVLADGADWNGRMGDRCGSMDKHLGGLFDAPGSSFAGFVGSPGIVDESDDAFGSTKKRSGGIRMFGELWKKKGHK